MDNRHLFLSAGGLLLAGTAPAARPAKPNVIVIYTDDHGTLDMGCFGAADLRTPHMDSLAASGVRFTQFYAAPVSSASRASLLTGQFTRRAGLTGNAGYTGLPLGKETLAERMRDNGYRTACIGKWHLGWDLTYKEGKAKTVDNIDFTKRVANGPTDRGFDYFYGLTSPSGPPYLYMVNDMAEKQPNTRFEESGGGLYKIKGGIGHSDWSADGMQPHLADKMLEYLDENKDSDKPFFLYMALTAPHIPLFPSKEFKGKSKIGDYGDLVMMIDDIVGRVNRKLKEIGKYDNTIVMFAADNGCAGYINMDRINRKGHYPSYIYRGYKSHGWEGGHRIPFILSWGDRYGHVTDNSLVSLTDLYATFADMLGYRIADDEAEDSFSFWPILDGSGNAARTDLIATSGAGYFTYRTPQYKLIFNAGNGSGEEYRIDG